MVASLGETTRLVSIIAQLYRSDAGPAAGPRFKEHYCGPFSDDFLDLAIEESQEGGTNLSTRPDIPDLHLTGSHTASGIQMCRRGRSIV
jgi:hypothetical protein